jgi:3-deoxy-manno-octulosonate cytidylyltransferase (CMP-KDO synthetase)
VTPIIVIPSRMASTRLPGKPLADIHGKPMIVHVLDRAREADIGPAAVACGDPEIAAAVRAAGGTAVMTDPSLPRGSDRVHAALAVLDPQGRHDVVVNLQGDLPMVDPAILRAVLSPLADPAVDIATLAAEIIRAEERDDPSVVKVVGTPVSAARLRALYFTRAVAPAGPGPLYHHIGLYAFRRAAFERFVALPPSLLEKREQLRALEAGMRIDVALVDGEPLTVDTPEDLARARAVLTSRS